MVSLPLTSSAFKLSGKIPVNSKALITLYHRLSAVFRKKKTQKLVVGDANFEADVNVGPPENITAVGSINEDESTNLENEPDYSFCKICLENKPSWQMFINDMCSHSFCNECTASHIVVKIKDKVEKVVCPSPKCKAKLNDEACRLIIPTNALVQWDELLCMSLIPESQKLYCPFLDCSALLVNDSGGVVTDTKCLVCKRLFCGECLVPWHSEFTCKEFKKLYSKKRGKGDRIVKTLAEKKRWKKCPNCKMYVELSQGCARILCRCNYEFCYSCGGKWADSHYGLCPRESQRP